MEEYKKYFKKIKEGDYFSARYKCKLCSSTGSSFYMKGFKEGGFGQHIKREHPELKVLSKSATI